MQVSVKLYSSLKRYSERKDGTLILHIKEKSTVEDLLKQIGTIPGETEIIKLNGKVVEENTPIIQKSTIEIFPMFGGG